VLSPFVPASALTAMLLAAALAKDAFSAGRVLVVVLLTAFVSWIAFRTMVLAVRGQLFPARLPADRCLKFQHRCRRYRGITNPRTDSRWACLSISRFRRVAW
jgi:hypothetical protein